MTDRERQVYSTIFKLSDEARDFVQYVVRKLAEEKRPGTAAVPSGTPQGNGKRAGKTGYSGPYNYR
jgi:hypothetical protein